MRIAPSFQQCTLAVAMLLLSLACVSEAQLREIPLPFPDTTRFRVQFVDNMHGWVGSLNGNILRTTNGGTTWTKHLSPYPTPKADWFEFTSSDDGILWVDLDFIGKLYNTRDAGQSWQPVPIRDSTFIRSDQWWRPWWHPSYYAISSTGSGRYILDGGHLRTRSKNSAPIIDSNYIAFSTDGGASWTKADSRSLRYGDCYQGGPVYQFENGEWGKFRTAMDLPDEYPISAFLKSADSGKSWRVAQRWDGVPMNAGQFFNDRLGVAYCTNYPAGVFVTTDAGEHWEQWPWIGGNYFTGTMVRDTVLYAVQFVTDSVERLFPNGTLVRTWRRAGRPETPIAQNVVSVTSAGDKVYFLTLEGRLFEYDEALVGVTPDPPAPGACRITLSPNPARDALHVSRDGDSAEEMPFSILNDAGKELVRGSLRHGESTKTISIAGLPSGAYVLVSQHPGNAQHVRFSIVR